MTLYAAFPNAHDVYEESGKVMCGHRVGYEDLDQAFNAVWITFYYMLPALTLMCFNVAILVQLRKITSIYKTIAKQHAALSSEGGLPHQTTTRASTTSQSTGNDDDFSSVAYTVENTDFMTVSGVTCTESNDINGERSNSRRSGKPRLDTGAKITLPTGVK